MTDVTTMTGGARRIGGLTTTAAGLLALVGGLAAGCSDAREDAGGDAARAPAAAGDPAPATTDAPIAIAIETPGGAEPGASRPIAPEPPAPTDGLPPLDELAAMVAAGQVDDAEPALVRHVRATPDDAEAQFLLGLVHHRRRDYALAEPRLARSFQLNPADPRTAHFLGWARFHLGDLDAAAEAFTAHLAVAPGEPDTHFGLGLVALESGDDAAAEASIQRAIQLIRGLESRDPARFQARRRDLGKCHARLGEIAFGRGDHAAARRQLETALGIDPAQYTAYHLLAQSLRRLGEDEKATIIADRHRQIMATLEARAAEARRIARATPADERAASPAPTDGADHRIDRGAERPPGSAPDPAPDSRFIFTDVTRASGIDMVTTSGRDPATQIVEVKGGGLALVDVDADGDLDVVVPNGATLDAPDAGPGARLYENLGDMRFRDATAASGIDYRGWGMGVAAGDVDGDGDVDLYIAGFGPDQLLLGDGRGRFRPARPDAGIDAPGWSTAVTMGDLDLDGDLDIVVTGYVDFDLADPPPPSTFRGRPVLAGPRGLPAARDHVFENLGDGRFRDITADCGVGAVPAGYGLAALIADLDDDGRPDIFIGNDSQPNRLFRRTSAAGLQFEDVGVASGLATAGDGSPRATMGVAVGDVDGDGRFDILTTNFAGEPNALHAGRAGGWWDDVTSTFAIGAPSRGQLGWGAALADLDHDGDEDLLVVNGHVYPGATRATMLADEAQPPLLMERDGRRFVRVRGPAWLETPARDRTLALGDLDRDGDLDAIIGGLNQPLRVLRNDGAGGAAITVRPESPLGCRVEVIAGDRIHRRWILGGTGYLSALPGEAHVGLADHRGSLIVRVQWPDGRAAERRLDAARAVVDVPRPRD